MEKNELSKEEFWMHTDKIFGKGFFDNENVTTAEIRTKFFTSVGKNLKLKLNPTYEYWMHRTVRDMFERDGDSPVVH
jgi:hypothetical protein